MDDQALSMEEPKKRLENLTEFMPGANDQVLAFGRFLAEYLGSELVPVGFVMGCELALSDIQNGVNGFTGKPIQSSLVGYPPIIYELVRNKIPDIADAVLPEDFAGKVKDFIAAVNASA